MQTSYICDLQFLIDYNFNTILLFQFAQVKMVCDTIDIIIPLKFIILELLQLFCVLNITYKYRGVFLSEKDFSSVDRFNITRYIDSLTGIKSSNVRLAISNTSHENVGCQQ